MTDEIQMNKLVKEALADMVRIEKTLPELKESNAKYWLRRMYTSGQINILEMVIKRNG